MIQSFRHKGIERLFVGGERRGVRPDLIEKIELSGPRLRFIAQRGASAGPVPIADLQWDVYLPHGYDLLASGGTVVPQQLDATPLAVSRMVQ